MKLSVIAKVGATLVAGGAYAFPRPQGGSMVVSEAHVSFPSMGTIATATQTAAAVSTSRAATQAAMSTMGIGTMTSMPLTRATSIPQSTAPAGKSPTATLPQPKVTGPTHELPITAQAPVPKAPTQRPTGGSFDVSGSTMTTQETEILQNIGRPMAEAFLNGPRDLPLARYLQLIGPQVAPQGVPYNPSPPTDLDLGILLSFTGRVLQTIFPQANQAVFQGAYAQLPVPGNASPTDLANFATQFAQYIISNIASSAIDPPYAWMQSVGIAMGNSFINSPAYQTFAATELGQAVVSNIQTLSQSPGNPYMPLATGNSILAMTLVILADLAYQSQEVAAGNGPFQAYPPDLTTGVQFTYVGLPLPNVLPSYTPLAAVGGVGVSGNVGVEEVPDTFNPNPETK